MIALNIKDIKVLNFTRRRKKSHPIGFNLSIGFQSKLSYPLLLIMLLLFNSCQKDFLTNVEPNIEAIARTGKSSISFAELQKKIRIAKSGTFNSMLSSTDEKDGKFQMTDEIVLLTDKVTMITTKGMSTYTLAVQQKPGQRATFQNVIFVDRNGDIETYVLTYKASKWFAAKFKVDKKAGFEGYVSYSKLDKNVKKYKGGTNKVSAESCTYFSFSYTVATQCAWPEKHWAGQGCQYEGTSSGPGFSETTKTIAVCTSSTGAWVSGPTTTDSSGGGGTDGGSVPTYPTLPLNYNPNCDYGYSSVSEAKNSSINTSSVNEGDCAYDDPNPAGLIANIQHLTGLLGLTWKQQEFLYEMDAMQGNTLTLDLLSYLEGNASRLPPSAILKATQRHIQLMVANVAYKDFVVNYMIGHSNSQWWENVSFLEIASNVDMIVNGTTDYFEALGFYDNEGHSDPGETTQTPTYYDPFHHLENPLELGGFNNNVAIFFEFANRNEPIHDALTDGLRNAIIQVNDNIPFPLGPIRQLHIYSTSEGPSIATHATYSNHYNGTALDISRINRVVIRLLPTDHPWVKNLQLAFEQDINRHENLGPYMLHRQGVYRFVPNHRGHIHFSVRP